MTGWVTEGKTRLWRIASALKMEKVTFLLTTLIHIFSMIHYKYLVGSLEYIWRDWWYQNDKTHLYTEIYWGQSNFSFFIYPIGYHIDTIFFVRWKIYHILDFITFISIQWRLQNFEHGSNTVFHDAGMQQQSSERRLYVD